MNIIPEFYVIVISLQSNSNEGHKARKHFGELFVSVFFATEDPQLSLRALIVLTVT